MRESPKALCSHDPSVQLGRPLRKGFRVVNPVPKGEEGGGRYRLCGTGKDWMGAWLGSGRLTRCRQGWA